MIEGEFRMVSDRRPDFPWIKFERLLHDPHVFLPQWEDGVSPDPKEAVRTQSFSPHQFIWLVMAGTRAVGFVAVGLRGRHWLDMHVGFREQVPGITKRNAIIWVEHRVLCELGFAKL